MSLADGLVASIRAHYERPGNGAGGCLHLVLDDLNVEDEHIRFCIDDARDHGDVEAERIARLLLDVSEGEREALIVGAFR